MRIKFFSAGTLFCIFPFFTIYIYSNKVCINKYHEILPFLAIKYFILLQSLNSLELDTHKNIKCINNVQLLYSIDEA